MRARTIHSSWYGGTHHSQPNSSGALRHAPFTAEQQRRTQTRTIHSRTAAAHEQRYFGTTPPPATAPPLHRHCTATAQPLHHHCTTTAAETSKGRDCNRRKDAILTRRRADDHTERQIKHRGKLSTERQMKDNGGMKWCQILPRLSQAAGSSTDVHHVSRAAVPVMRHWQWQQHTALAAKSVQMHSTAFFLGGLWVGADDENHPHPPCLDPLHPAHMATT
jgi:hypothetical protein